MVVETFKESGKRKNASKYADYADELKQLIKQHYTKSNGRRRHRKLACGMERGRLQSTYAKKWIGHTDLHSAQHAATTPRKKCELYQEREQPAEQLVQLEMSTADLNIMRHILSSRKDVLGKFWRYLGTLIGRGQMPTIVDKLRGLEVDVLD